MGPWFSSAIGWGKHASVNSVMIGSDIDLSVASLAITCTNDNFICHMSYFYIPWK